MLNDNAEHAEQPSSSNPASDTAQPYIEAYVERMKQTQNIRSVAVEQAFLRVPRHRFVSSFYLNQGNGYTRIEYDPHNPEPQHLDTIYSGAVLVTRLTDGLPTSSASQSELVAFMLELLALDRGMRVLEIGAGTGYNAALMAHIVGDGSLVTTVDVQADVVAETQAVLAESGSDQIHVVAADGFYGVPESAPYDRIVATVGCPDLSPHWVEQLSPSGSILLPLRHAGANPLIMISKQDDGIIGKFVGFSGFMAIQGALGDPGYYGFPVPLTQPPTEQIPVWPDFGKVSDADGNTVQRSHLDFWFYLGVRDRRAAIRSWLSGFGLVDPHSGHWATFDHKHLTFAGDRTLLDDLSAYHDEWRNLGAPSMSDFTVRFVPAGDASLTTPQQRQWIVQGRYYARLFSLAMSLPSD